MTRFRTIFQLLFWLLTPFLGVALSAQCAHPGLVVGTPGCPLLLDLSTDEELEPMNLFDFELPPFGTEFQFSYEFDDATVVGCSVAENIVINCLSTEPDTVSTLCSAWFGYDPAPDNGPFVFYATQTNNPDNYAYFWNFSDGTTSTEANPQHTFSADGYYAVCLTVTNTLTGCTSQECQNVYVFSGDDDCFVNLVFQPQDDGSITFEAYDLLGGSLDSVFWVISNDVLTLAETGNPINVSLAGEDPVSVCATYFGNNPDGDDCTGTNCTFYDPDDNPNNDCFASFSPVDNQDGTITLINQSSADTSILWTVVTADGVILTYPDADSLTLDLTTTPVQQVCLDVSDDHPTNPCSNQFCQDFFSITDPNCDFNYQLSVEPLTDSTLQLTVVQVGTFGPPVPQSITWIEPSTGTVLAQDVATLVVDVPTGSSGAVDILVELGITYGWGATCSTVLTGVFYDTCFDFNLIDPDFACPTIEDPVCGCDGVTYENACVAEKYAGISSWTPGACAPLDGCEASFDISYLDNGEVMVVNTGTGDWDHLQWTAEYGFQGVDIENVDTAFFTLDNLHGICLSLSGDNCQSSTCEIFDPFFLCDVTVNTSIVPGTDSVLLQLFSAFGPVSDNELLFVEWTGQTTDQVYATGGSSLTVPFDPTTGFIDVCVNYNLNVGPSAPPCSGTVCVDPVSTDCNANFSLVAGPETLTLGNISTGSYDSFAWTITVNDTLIFSNDNLPVISIPTPEGETVMCLEIFSADGSCTDQHCLPITFIGTPPDPVCVADFTGELTDEGLLLTNTSTGSFDGQTWFVVDLEGNLLQGDEPTLLVPVDSTQFYPFALVCLEVFGPNCSNGTCLDFYLGEPDSLCNIVDDCIWPGDTDNDGLANNNDLLQIGLGFGATGNARGGATIDWQPQWADDWDTDYTATLNHKHGDADGDGRVNPSDLAAIHHNYEAEPFIPTLPTQTGAPPLQLTFVTDSIYVTDDSPELLPITAELRLGTPDAPAADVQGVALALRFDPDLAEGTETVMTYADGDFFGAESQVLHLQQNLGDVGRTDLAFTHRGTIGADGSGLLATLDFVIISDIIGSRARAGGPVPFEVQIGNLTLVDAQGEPLGYEVAQNTATIWFIDQTTTTGTQAPDLSDQLRVFPNPTTEVLRLRYPADWEVETVELFNPTGQRMIAPLPTADRLDVSELTPGVYWLRLRTAEGVATRRVVIR